MSRYLIEAQKIVYDALNGNLPGVNVFDDVPDLPAGMPEDSFPYVVLGRDYSNAFDTDSWNGERVSVQVDVWSRYNGHKEAKEIMASVYELLHKQELTRAGVSVVDCLHVYSTIPDVGASNYVHGISRYELTLTEVI